MENAILPTGKALEPNEGARNPMALHMSPPPEHPSSRKQITFADDTDLSDRSASQSQASYKEVLSQPAVGLSHLQKLLWLQKRRSPGLWVQCDDCNRWRFLVSVLDSYELPSRWVCRMNPDSSTADCSIPEAPIRLREEEDLIHSLYSAGSVVWARMPGWPWWPAMVDDCPDTEQFYWLDGFSDIPTHYNVVFFDSTDTTRGWIAPDNLKPYSVDKKAHNNKIQKKYKIRLETAMKQADDACKLPLAQRLEKFSFIAKYKGQIASPKKITKKDLIRHQKKMKRRYNIDFPVEESDSDDENVSLLPKTPKKKKNMIMLGTPKRDIAKKGEKNMIVLGTPKRDIAKKGEKNMIVLGTPKRDIAKKGEKNMIVLGTPKRDIAKKGEKNMIVLGTPKRDIAKKGEKHVGSLDNDATETISQDLIDHTPVIPRMEKPRKRIQENMNVSETPSSDSLQGKNATGLNEFKQPNSMVVQVGSTADTFTTETESYDNDTSKTYVPDLKQTLESTDNETEIGTQEFETRAVTPNSDDFDF